MRAKGVVFDLFGTLVGGWGEGTAKLRMEELAAVLEVDPGEFVAVMDSSYTERANGSLGLPRETLQRLCARSGTKPSAAALDRGARLRVEQFREILSTPSAGVPQLLVELRKQGIRLGLISDCSAETPLVWPELQWARPIEATLFSWTERMRKPDLRLFRRAAQLLDLAPQDCLYLGDGGSHELSGAEEAGMRAVRVRLPRADDEVPLQYDPDPAWGGQEISSLSQIWELLDG
ncbi:MAG: HAD family hydrolase [Candidatus Dormiibacterota bacterium]